jgi:hypothetical protein
MLKFLVIKILLYFFNDFVASFATLEFLLSFFISFDFFKGLNFFSWLNIIWYNFKKFFDFLFKFFNNDTLILRKNFENFLFFDLGGEPISGGEVGGTQPPTSPPEAGSTSRSGPTSSSEGLGSPSEGEEEIKNFRKKCLNVALIGFVVIIVCGIGFFSLGGGMPPGFWPSAASTRANGVEGYRTIRNMNRRGQSNWSIGEKVGDMHNDQKFK